MDDPILIWCLLCDQHGHVRPVEECLGSEARFVYDAEWDPAAMLHAAPDVVLCVNEHHHGVTQCLLAAGENRIPTLTVQDGILEWRCQYENPRFGAGGGSPQHQPVFSDKIACIGRQSARQIERWGNAGKCEVVGMPRLDYLLSRPRTRLGARPGPRLLVMTAKKAGFTREQVETTLRSLRDVQQYLRTRPEIEVRWRISRECAEQLAVENSLKAPETRDLATALEQVDAVVTTPSTAMLESMIMGKPVAILDYHNVPRFVPSSWTISAQEHIASVLREILNPPPRKMRHQEDCLHDALECMTPATPRFAELIRQLAHRGRTARRSGDSLRLPSPLIPVASAGAAPGPPLEDLYPDADPFREDDVCRLKVRLARAEVENRRLRQQLRGGSLAIRMAVVLRARLQRVLTRQDGAGRSDQPRSPRSVERG